MYDKILKGLFYPDLILLNNEYRIIHSEGFISRYLKSSSENYIGIHFNKSLKPEYSESILKGIEKAERTKKHVHVDNRSGECSLCIYQVEKNIHEKIWIIQFGQPAYNEANPDSIVIESNEKIPELPRPKETLDSRIKSFQNSHSLTFSTLFHSIQLLVDKLGAIGPVEELREGLHELEEDLTIREKELSQLRKDFNLFHELSGLGILKFNTNMELRYWNEQGLELLLSSTPEKSSRLEELNFIDNKVRMLLTRHVHKALETQSPQQFNTSTSHGFALLFFLYPLFNERKDFDGLILSINDISEQIQLQEELKTERHKMELASLNAKLAVWHWDLRTNEVTGNKMLKEMYGLGDPFSIEEWQRNIHPEDVAKASMAAEDYRSGKSTVFSPKYRYLHKKNNTLLYFQERGISVSYNDSGEAIELTGITLDITDLWQVQQELSESLTFSEKLTESIGYSILVHDLETTKDIYSNSTYQELSGYTMQEMNLLSDDEFWEHIHPEDHEPYHQYISKLTNIKEPVSIEYRFKRKDGKWIWCFAKDSPFEWNDNGKVQKVIGVIMDITESKQMKEDLLDAKHRAEAANIYKNSFLTNMSHEIRTPMNGIVAFSQLLQDEQDIEEQKTYIEIIQSSSDQLLKLVDDIIDLARMEAGELELEYQRIPLLKFLSEVYHGFHPLVKNEIDKDINFILNIPNDLEGIILNSDKNRLHQVILNLLNNALKFSHSGTISIGLEQKSKDSLQIYVQDEGIGISPEFFKSIFERFNQVEYKSRVKYGGAGLGLAICKGIIMELEGEITVKSEPGRGSRFTINLPIEPISKEKEDYRERNHHLIQSSDMENKNILLVDDDETVLFFLQRALKSTKAKLSVARTGLEALEKYMCDPKPDAILMDVRMPELDGIKATEKILEYDPKAKIIIQTAFALQQEKEKCFQAGCVGYLNKPIDIDILIETLAEHLE